MSFLFLLFLFTRETFSKVNSQTHNKTPMQDYSNSDYTGKISTIHINEDYSSNEITNSKFTDCALPSGENYLFSVQKDINFDNVEFSFSSTKVGAIKINHPGQISVRNCVFRKCSVSNGLGNALYISTKNGRKNTKDEEEEIIIEVNIENNYYDSCGNTGYVNLVESKLAFMRNNTFDFTKSPNSCGAFCITCCGNITIIDCHFIKTTAKGTISYQPDSVANENDFVIIQDCTFKNCLGMCCYFDVKSGSKEKISIHSCYFNDCQKGNDDSIAFSTSLNADSIELSVFNNTFTQIQQNDFYIVNLNIAQYKAGEPFTFENNVFNTSCGAVQINHPNGHAIFTSCVFTHLNQEPISLTLNSFIIQDCIFRNCGGKVEVKGLVSDANIERCIFTDFYYDDSLASVITISNKNCRFTDNIINFTSNNKAISGLSITSHGNIFVAYNQFINYCAPKDLVGGINIKETDTEIDSSDSIVIFNYNTLVNSGDKKFGTFSIQKANLFEFNHNIIKECHIDKGQYSSQINFTIDNNAFNNDFTFYNLTISDCSAKSLTGGGLGIWVVFGTSVTGTLNFKNCSFINLHNDQTGGAFESGNASTDKMKLNIDNCTFIGNQSPYGGALSIQSVLEAQIRNSNFVSNQADQGGGAIYIYSKRAKNDNLHLPSCIITKCKFELNKDKSNNGHAIYFKYGLESSTHFEISDCNFTDNNVDGSDGGFTISSDAPYFNITNVNINFESITTPTIGLRVEGNTKQFNATDYSFKSTPVAIQLSANDQFSFDCINLLRCISPNTLFSFSSSLTNFEISNIDFDTCTSSTGFIIDIPGVESVNISNSKFQGCTGTLFSISQSTKNFALDSCILSSNVLNANSSLIYINSAVNAIIKNCTFASNTYNYGAAKVGGIYVLSNDSTKPVVSIIDSSFSFSVGSKDFQIANSILVEGNTAQLTIKGTRFEEKKQLNKYAIVLQTSNLEMSDVTFDYTYPILFDMDRIQNINFENIKSSISPLLIVPQSNSYIIDSVRFHNCKCTNYVIRAETDHFQIFNSTIEFDEATADKTRGGININKIGNHDIISTTFIKTGFKKGSDAFYSIKYLNGNTKVDRLLNITGCTFDSCVGNDSGINVRAFNLQLPHRCVFQNNIIKNNIIKEYLVEIELFGLEEFNFDSCKFINNINSGTKDYGGGSGIMINSKAHLIFTNCNWINNTDSRSQGGGAFQLGEKAFELTFSKCIFENNRAKKGGALAIQSVYPLVINECSFINNEAYESAQFGGAIYLNPKMETCEITHSTFIGNHAASGKGHVIFVEDGANANVIIDSSNNFTNNNNENGGGSAILFNGNSLNLNFPTFSDKSQSRFIEFGTNCNVEVNGVEFVNCIEKSGEGNAILIDSDAISVKLSSCTFTNCGNQGYVVKDLGASVIFEDCSFVFDNSGTACCALDIKTNKSVEVSGCTFLRNKNANDANEKAGTLYYHPQAPESRAIFTSCAFIECTGNVYKTFSIQTSIVPDFSYITINNTATDDKYIGEISLSNAESFTLSFCSINNNEASSDYGGGSAFLILSEAQVFELTFQSCEWTNNHAVYTKDFPGNGRHNGVGGAYQRGIDSSLKNTELIFDNCTFLDNKSDREGGALAIQTNQAVHIKNCYFKGNRAGLKVQNSLKLLFADRNDGYGGAVYIDPDFVKDENDVQRIPYVDIEYSVFIRNEAVDAHAIYIRGGVKTQLINDFNVFTDNGKSGATIISECDELIIDPGTIFNFTNSSESSHPYEFGPGARAIYENTIFDSISASGDSNKGNAIHIPDGVKTPTIKNCTFINCGTSGYVVTIYSNNQEEPINFINNTIYFDDPLFACKGLGIFSQSQITIQDCIFQRCNNYLDSLENITGGGIYINPPDVSIQNNRNLEMINVTFEEMNGISQRCFGIKWWSAGHLTMKQINIRNSTNSSYTGAVYVIEQGEGFNVDLEEWTFINNTANSEFGGGCGLWIAPADRDKITSYKLNFKKCIWDDNTALNTVHRGQGAEGRKDSYNGLGGACQFGFSDSTYKCELSFLNCTFNNNKADCEGGALAIQTTQNCLIRYCQFTGNHANQVDSPDALKLVGGGAIFIDPDFKNQNAGPKREPKIIIDQCIFEDNFGSNGHAVSLAGNDADVTITDCSFNNNGDNANSVIYSVCPKLEVEGNNFTSDDRSTRAIELAVFAKIEIKENTFTNFHTTERGGAIILREPRNLQGSTLLAVTTQEYEIRNCTFIRCGSSMHGGSLFIAQKVQQVTVEDCIFDGGSIDKNSDFNGEGVAIYISNIEQFTISSSVKFINQNCNGKFLIASECQDFKAENIVIENTDYGAGIKGIQIKEGTATIKNVFFSKCISGLEVKQSVILAKIQDCIFSDCYERNSNQYKGIVVKIANTECTFTRNIVNFTNNTQASTGLWVTSHGDIHITHNKFIKVRRSADLAAAIIIVEVDGSEAEGNVIFNYNLIENVGTNVEQFGALRIIKTKQFNINHNILNGCKRITGKNGYLCEIDLKNSIENKKEFTLENFTVSNCETHCQTGGSFGLWLVFEGNEGTFKLQNCHFNNNIAGKEQGGGYGGAFECGRASNNKMTLIIDNCDFTDNTARIAGGALSFNSTKPVTITNCQFIRNTAEEKGGGAIYIENNMDTITISHCDFTSNVDTQNKGHAVLFSGIPGADTEFIIENNCQFIDNGDLQGNKFKGYTIVSGAPNFQFKDSTIKFNNIEQSTAGLQLEGSGTSNLANIKFIQTNNAHWTNTNLDYEGLAIVIRPTTSSVEIDSCIFDHCGTWGGKSAIYDEGANTAINNCQFLNDDHGDNRVGAVYIKSIGRHVITNIYAQNCWGDYGAFQYKPETQTTASQRIFTFRNVTIDKVFGVDRMALNFNLRNADQLDIEDVTIKNVKHDDNQLKNCIVGLEIDNDLSEFTFNKFNFTNNEVRGNYMGGSGIWVQAYNNKTLKFVGCTFIGNHAEFNDDNSHLSGYGGAWSVGKNTDIKDISVTMTECLFDANHADKCGGALCIVSTNQVTIEDCIFNGNYANDNGGAIYLDPDHQGCPEQFIISGCSFSNNHATYDSTLFFHETSENTLIDVSDCTFTENVAGKNIVYSTARHLIVHDLKFEFPDINSNARPLCLGRRSKTEVYNVQFIRCSMNNEEGTAIKGEEGIGNLYVYDSRFQDCKGTNSSVYLLGSPIYFNNVEFLCTGDARVSGLNIQGCGNHIEVIDCSFTNMKSFKQYISPLNLVSNGEDEDFIFTGLTFTNCHGENLRCFSLSAYKPFTFSNITVKDNALQSYLGQINLNGRATLNDVFVFDNCKWYRNVCKSDYGGGAGLWLVNNRQACVFEFYKCLFERNQQTKNGGGFQDGFSNTVSNKLLRFNECRFINNQAAKHGGALAIETIQPFTVDHCIFENNIAQTGGAIYICTPGNSNTEGSITNCVFTNNTATSGNGTSLSIDNSLQTTITFEGTNKITNTGETGSTIYSQCGNLIVKNLLFDSTNNAQKNFRAAHLRVGSKTTFDGCRFTGTGLSKGSLEGQAVLADNNTEQVIFNNCVLTNCGITNNQYAIESTAQELQFIGSTIATTSCGGIRINKLSTFEVSDSTFKDISAQSAKLGGGICYNPDRKGNLRDCNVIVSGCTFNNITSGNGRALFMKLAKISTFSNCTIKNMPDGNYIVTIGHESQEQAQSTFDRIIFMDNKAACSDEGGGGGAGIWFSQVYKLILLNCQFVRNQNTKDANGGALGYCPGETSNKKIELEFNGCFFQDNKVKSGKFGGALCITARDKPVTINDCTFTNTILDTARQGGAIYINASTTQPIIITNSRFRNLKVTETDPDQFSGDAIYIERVSSNILIQDCDFTDCGTQGKSSVISSNGENVIFERSKITFTNTQASCKGIRIRRVAHFELIDSTISNCLSPTDGAAFQYTPPKQYSGSENLVFRNLVIDNCESTTSLTRAMFMTLTTDKVLFYNITLQHIKGTSKGFIFTVGHADSVLVDVVEFVECNFVDCTTNIDDGNGGGMGLWCTGQSEIKFTTCIFRELTAKNGGAISYSYGATNNRQNVKLTFTECLFDQNTATINGSALYIRTKGHVQFYRCNFTDNNNNNANQNGGAIFIADICQDISIERTEFYSNTQMSSSSNGNAIFFQQPATTIEGTKTIYDCTFVDCGTKGSVVYSYGAKINFFQSKIKFTQPGIGAKGLHVQKPCNIHIANSTFTGCFTNENNIGAGFIFGSDSASTDPGLVTLESTVFENNNGTNGNAIFGYFYDIPVIRDVTIRGHKKGNFIMSLFFHRDFENDVVLERCIFEDNYFIANAEGSSDGGGSGIWIARTSRSTIPVTFLDCTFRNNKASSFGGAMAYGKSKNLENVPLTYQGCVFTENVAGKYGGALYINTIVLLVIEDCEFSSNTVTDTANGAGNAIVLKASTNTIISDTTIINNGNKGTAIVFEGKSFSALDSNIEFDSVEESCRGIEFRNKATIELEGVEFLRCNAKGGEGGGIFYHEAIPNTDELVFSLDSCIFDSNDALNGSALLLNISSIPEIYGCTFKNHQSGSFIFTIVFSLFQMVYEFTDCTFENNYHETSADHEDGGGSGIWIANNKQIAAGRLMQIYFTGIKFINNRSPSVGGAFAYGRSPTVYPSELYFDSCQFDGNTAKTDGGALWVITKSPYEIQYCSFKNNLAERKGGSIMVETLAPIATIQTSSFEMESANNDGNAIYVSDKTPRFILSGNNFVDCGIDKNVITIDTTIAGIEGNTIQFNDELETCRGINLKSAGTFEITDNTFILCKADNGGGIKYENVNGKPGVENLIISENTFNYCIALNNGCAMHLRVNVAPTFGNNNVDNCKYGTMIIYVSFIKEVNEYVLNGFVFENNQFHNSQGSEDAGGCGFWIDNNNKPFDYIFRGVTWKENTAYYAGGAFAYGRNSNYKQNNLIFDGCTFINNKCKEQLGGALWFATSGTISIENCNFTSNKALGTSSYGGAIYFDSTCTAQVSIKGTEMKKNSAIDGNALYLPSSLREFHIDDCTLLNNGNLNSTIYTFCPTLLIENSEIGFSKYELKCRAIRIYTTCSFTIRNCNISNCDGQEAGGGVTAAGNQAGHGGGIYYKVDSSIRTVRSAEENIVIEDVIFTNCKGSNGAACMIHPTTSNFIFNRNTIQDCRCGKFIFVIITQTFVENFNINDCTFKHNLMNNPVGSEDGGGSGMWIANDKNKIPQGSYTHLTFTNCKWLENQASTCGGAFAYGQSLTIKNTAITFDDCQFSDNVAKNKEGGAIWINTSVPFLINNCKFYRNKAKGDSPIGGAITVAASAPQINIRSCYFENNEARDGNAIYVRYTTQDMNITDCTFQNNGLYGAIVANEAKSICVDSSYFQFDSTANACRGIHFVSRTNALVRDSHFRNCRTTESAGGGGIFYSNTLGNNEDDELLTIEGCFFNNTQAPNGCALLTWLETPIILRNNLFWYNTFGKFIIAVFYNKYVNETIVEDCYFEHNFFQNDETNRDGGGSGLWIANSRGLVPANEIQKLTFAGCTWTNNVADSYGGALSYGRSPTLKGVELEFRDCNFINNTARKTYGGALYIITDKPLTITDCFFDGNSAGGIGGAVYFSKFGDVTIADSKFARNNAYEGGAITADGRNKVKFDSLVFAENKADVDAPNLLLRHFGASPFDVKNCKFHFNKRVGQAQVCVRNNAYEHSQEAVNFEGCCFTYEGNAVDETAFHIKASLVSGTIVLGSGNCFDLPQELSFSFTTSNENNTKVEIAEGIFECDKCPVPVIPTSPPTNMPTQSPSPTPEATPRATDKLPDPTPRPTVDEPTTSIPARTPARTVTPLPTEVPATGQTASQSQGTSAISINPGDTVSKGKSNAKKIGMIAGITVGVVVIIVVVIILLWLFVFRRRNTAGINDEGYKPNTLDNEASNEVDSTPASIDDPIWSYQSQENPLYNDDDHNVNEDENAFGDDNNNFEESWGNTI